MSRTQMINKLKNALDRLAEIPSGGNQRNVREIAHELRDTWGEEAVQEAYQAIGALR